MKQITRAQASALNPLIGISLVDTVSLVSTALRAMADSTEVQALVVVHITNLAAAALEYEEGAR